MEKGQAMKLSAVTKFLVPAALGVLVATQVGATTLCTGTLAQALAATGQFSSCTDGTLSFSNFAANLSVQDGTSNPTATGTNVTVSESTSGGNNTYDVVIDFSGGNPSTSFFDGPNDTGEVYVQYLITPTSATINAATIGMQYGILNGTSAATVSEGAVGCDGQAFADPNGGDAGSCADLSSPTLFSDLNANVVSGNTAGDPSLLSNEILLSLPPADTGLSLGTVGVFNDVTASGDTSGSGPQAAIGDVTNSFIYQTSGQGAPEPATFVLLGGALVALGTIRRRKKSV
jgi:hypothetical protein